MRANARHLKFGCDGLKTHVQINLALNQQMLFVNKKDDTVAFSSHCYYNQKFTRPNQLLSIWFIQSNTGVQ